jgi:hypothetical protein
MSKSVRLYHRTRRENADKIIASGFIDGRGNYLVAGCDFTGVWVSNVPLDSNEGAEGDTLLEVLLAVPLARINDYEWIEEGKGYREWLVPAALLNSICKVRIIDEFSDRALQRTLKRWRATP